MRTDRRGPLAAFIVVAVIAAILLVTSVRSQAAPGWLRAPTATVADLPAPNEVWTGASDHVRQAVRHGLLLVHKTETADSGLAAAVVRPAVLQTQTRTPTRAQARAQARAGQATHRAPRAASSATPHGSPAPHGPGRHLDHGLTPGVPPGRHLGWQHLRGQGRPWATPPGRGSPTPSARGRH